MSGPIGHEKIHYEAPSAQDVPALMADFLSWFNAEADCDLLVKAGVAHLRFLTVHPFDDGNGRIARALTEMLLARSDGSARRCATSTTSSAKGCSSAMPRAAAALHTRCEISAITRYSNYLVHWGIF